MITRTCKLCGKEFQTFKAWLRNGKAGNYCSISCASKAGPHPNHRVKLICHICGKEYEVKRYAANESKCCSYACLHIYIGQRTAGEKHSNWKGGISKRKHATRRWRKRVFIKCDYKCVKCGCTDKSLLQAHHIKSFSENEDLRTDVNNGEVLCLDCHAKEHEEIEKFILSRRYKNGKKELDKKCSKEAGGVT